MAIITMVTDEDMNRDKGTHNESDASFHKNTLHGNNGHSNGSHGNKDLQVVQEVLEVQ